MKKSKKFLFENDLLFFGVLLASYIFLFYQFYPASLLSLGLFAILISLFSLNLKEGWPIQVVSLLSPIITLPAYSLLIYFEFEMHGKENLAAVFIAIYGLIYSFIVYKNFWTFTKPKLLKPIVFTFIILSILGFIAWDIESFCLHALSKEKGGIEDIEICKSLGLYLYEYPIRSQAYSILSIGALVAYLPSVVSMPIFVMITLVIRLLITNWKSITFKTIQDNSYFIIILLITAGLILSYANIIFYAR